MASLYVRVDGGVVVEGPVPLPRNWKNVSGLSALDDKTLAALGWLPVDVVHPDTLDHATEALDAPTFLVTRTKVVATYAKRALSQPEIERREADNLRVRNTDLSPGLPDVVAWLVETSNETLPQAVKAWMDRYLTSRGRERS